MADSKVCGKCNENDAELVCCECGVDLCEICKEEVSMDATHPAARIKGYSKPGALTLGTKTKIACKDCLSEIDVFD